MTEAMAVQRTLESTKKTMSSQVDDLRRQLDDANEKNRRIKSDRRRLQEASEDWDAWKEACTYPQR